MTIPIIPHDEPAAETATVAEEPRRDWLELPRNITLKRFVNTKRETHFIGQWRNENPCGDTNPRRIYRVDVCPVFPWNEATSCRDFQVVVFEDDKVLFSISTTRGRACAEYPGVKALKAWLNYCGSRRRGKQSLKLHRKRMRANRRARKSAERSSHDNA